VALTAVEMMLGEAEEEEGVGVVEYPMLSKLLTECRDDQFLSIVGDQNFRKLMPSSGLFPTNANLDGFLGKRELCWVCV
jgi:hypothetical protein